MQTKVSSNFSKLNASFLFFPFVLLLGVFLFLYFKDALNYESYINIQKNVFMYLNAHLAKFPNIMINATEFGNCLVLFSFIAILIVYAPIIWEVLITASLLSAVVTNLLKKLFSVPRPAAFYNDGFAIIGSKLAGHNSFPSGHSITVFTTLTIILFAFMPAKKIYKVLWCSFILSISIFFVITRVGVGAHHPIDVLVGSILGYSIAICGILFTKKFRILAWIKTKNFKLCFIVILVGTCAVLFTKIISVGLLVFYLALISLVFSIDIIMTNYVKK